MNEKDFERFWLSYVRSDECWIWIRTMFRDGYGAFHLEGKLRRAHRVSYERTHKIILTPDQFLHHNCKNKACINPAHLEIVSQLTHTDSAIYGNKEKTYCPHGHKYTPENTYWNRGNTRECLQCKLIRSRRQYKCNKQKATDNKREFADKIKQLAAKYAERPENSKL